jgi:hypothetical protein
VKMSVAWMVLLLPVLVGCRSVDPKGAVKADARPEEETGTLDGKVVIGPNCPVERVGVPCPPPPSVWKSHMVRITDAAGRTVQELAADRSGHFRTELPPGSYSVDFVPHDIGMKRGVTPQSVQVRAGQTTTVVIDIDTGMR